MSGDSKCIVAQKAPYVLEMESGTYYWCACGRSKGQPFCDGSHKDTGLSPQKVEVTQKTRVAWCGCKHSQAGHECDGTHKNL